MITDIVTIETTIVLSNATITDPLYLLPFPQMRVPNVFSRSNNGTLAATWRTW